MRRLTLLLMLLLALFAGCGDDDDDGGGGSSTTETAVETTTETTAETEPGECREVEQPEAKEDGGAERPSAELSGDYSVTFETNCGSFTVDVDEEGAGLTAASFVALAESGFYDNTYFHRIVPKFVIQGGDPTGTGSGGPGYTTEDAPAPDATYVKGTVAMAKAGAEPPGTAGSQFFVVTDDAGGAGLTADYAIVGEISDGLGVVTAIGKLGDATQQPTQVVVIEKATVEGG